MGLEAQKLPKDMGPIGGQIEELAAGLGDGEGYPLSAVAKELECTYKTALQHAERMGLVVRRGDGAGRRIPWLVNHGTAEKEN